VREHRNPTSKSSQTASWLTYHCRVREADVAAVETCLEEAGAQAITCRAADGEALIVDTLDGTQELWPVCDVSGLFDPDPDLAGLEARFSASAVIPLRAWTTTLRERNWHESWRDQFHPQSFADRLWVCPTWLTVPHDADLVIRIDPGMAFGTGNHATTALCLEWLAGSKSVAGAKVLDYGCGSGILAIAAAKLGAAEVTAVDIDPAALSVCRDNAKSNGLTEIVITEPETLGQRRFDLIVANILLEPLTELVARFGELITPGGHIVLSGILAEQAARLLAAYASAFKMQTQREQGEWALLAGVRDDSLG